MCERRTARLPECGGRHGARSEPRGRTARGDGQRPRHVAGPGRPRRRVGPRDHPWPDGHRRRGARIRRDAGADASPAPDRRDRPVTDLATVALSAFDGTVVVQISGEIDLSNVDDVRNALAAALPDLPVVVVDLSGTEYLDSAGITMLFRLANRLGYNRQELQLVVPPDAPIRAVIRLTGLDKVIPVKDTVG